MLRGWIATVFVLGLAGCADETATTEPAEVTTGAEAPEPGGPPEAWEAMSFEARKSYMQDQVLPTMKAKFQAFDAEHYADFGCETCHGANPKEREFEMPNPDLPALPSPETSEWEEMMGEPSGVVAFMMNDVVPTMSDLLGVAPYDPETGEGFGCFACHTMSAPDAPEPGSGLGEEAPDPAMDTDFPEQ